MDWVHALAEIWHYVVTALSLLLSVVASSHALLHKRDSRAATLWVGFVWFVPVLGATFYFILGVNRIKRRAILLRGNLERFCAKDSANICSVEQLETLLPESKRNLSQLARATSKILERPLLPGNRVDVLVNGDAAFPAMLEAIAAAKQSVTLCTYIFDRDEAGILFVDELAKAVRRGVEVRVLIDATGTRYSWPPILGALRRAHVPHARFLRAFPFWQLLTLNLRNHRKILVADGRIGFTGGMNIRAGHWLEKRPARPVQDLHFRVEGPLVAQLQEVFAEDWFFTTRESLHGERWFPKLEPRGTGIARGVADGPDEDFEKLRWTILAALAAAEKSVRIATPYFLPEATIIAALNVAALRGVHVEILLPSKSNLRFVQWASAAQWWQVLESGCQIWLSPPPFDHSKLFVVDDCWTLVGSTNWDPRSLRLNFEFNIENYDPTFARTVAVWFDHQRSRSRQITLADADARPIPIRLRDAAARLFAPFL